MNDRKPVLAMLVLLAIAGCASQPPSGSATAPAPTKAVDPARFYTGTWLEIARRPMTLTDGCVAGTTSYKRNGDGTVSVIDACRQGGRSGRLRSITGKGTIEDPGTNAKLHVRYNAFISRDYWIIDHAANYSWFIEASPDFRDLWIFTRRVPSKAELNRLLARARSFGYDTHLLEFPPQPPR